MKLQPSCTVCGSSTKPRNKYCPPCRETFLTRWNLARKEKGTKPCHGCGTPTHNPRFCSQSCAASTNNQKTPKRKRSRVCSRCPTPVLSNRKMCTECFRRGDWRPKRTTPRRLTPKSNQDLARKRRAIFVGTSYDNVSIGLCRETYNSNFLGTVPYIRNLARKVYMGSSRLKSCLVCGYSLHVDVCHIRAIKDFPDTTRVSEINALSNLVALCKNHHWELDNGHLTLPPLE